MSRERAATVSLDSLDFPGVLRVFQEVAQSGAARVIVQGDKEVVRVMPPKDKLAKSPRQRSQPTLSALRARIFAAIEREKGRSADLSEEEVMAEVDEVIAEVRQELRQGNG